MTMRRDDHVGFLTRVVVLFALLQVAEVTEACALCQLKGRLTCASPSLVSSNQVFALGFFPLPTGAGFGFGIWHKAHPGKNRTVMWMPQQVRNLQLHSDAFFELRASEGGVQLHLFSHGHGVWTSTLETYHHPGEVLELRDDGNLVLLDATRRIVWQSFDTPTDTLLPGQAAAVKNRPLVARRGPQDLVEGRYSCTVLQTELSTGADSWFLTLNWNGHLRATWDASTWSGPCVPLSDGTNLYPYAKGYPGADDIYLNATDGSLYARNGSTSLQVLRSSTTSSEASYLRRVTLDHDGVLRLYSYIPVLGWIVESSWPQQPCAVFAQCGPFGVCQPDSSSRPTCSCPEDFQFIDQTDHFQGCKRRFSIPLGNKPCDVQSEMRKMGNMVYMMASHMAPPKKNITEGQCVALCSGDCLCAGLEFWDEVESLCFLKQEPFLNGGFPRSHRVRSNTYYKAYSPPPEPSNLRNLIIAATLVCLAFGIMRKYWSRHRTPLLHPEKQPREKLTETIALVKRLLLRMDELRKKVTIWHTQCEHLVMRCEEQVERMAPPLDIILAKTPHSMTFLCSKVICCLLEGQELLQLCSDAHAFTKAAFSLSSPQPGAPSKFALVLRELDWTLDYILFVADGGDPHISQWEWCEGSSRLKYGRDNVETNDGGNVKMGDGARQADDREALRTSLTTSGKGSRRSLRRSPSALFSFSSRLIPYVKLPSLTETNEMELEDIWTKRLLATCHSLDWFWLNKPEFTFVKTLAKGASKQVNECEWLGERVAVAVLDKVSKQQVEAEAEVLATVQHPNVVEFSGYAYNDRKCQGFLVTELMEQDLGSLISSSTSEGPPFAMPVAVDILLQIVEAMIHLKDCGVLHRDLKPRNCLASPKYGRASIPWADNIPMFYTIKLIDFGAAKLRDQDSYFHTAKQGTPYYMAPEVYGKPVEQSCSYTWSADVYSFGVLCFEVFTGVAPFAIPKFLDLQDFVQGGGRPSFPFELPELVKSLIERCWAKDPALRPCFQDIQRDLWQCKLYAAQLS